MTQKTKFRFTQRALDQLPAHKAEAASKSAEYSDSEVIGLRILVNKQGRKFFYFRFTIHGQKRTLKIGEYPALALQEARRTALDLRAEVDRGIDPTVERDRQRATPTLEEFALNDYLPHAADHKRTANSDESKLRCHVIPKFGQRRLCDITLRDIQAYHAQIKQSHCPATANRHLSLISKMYKCAIQWGIVDKNPCIGIAKFQENNAQQKFLNEEDIKRLFAAMAVDSNQTAVAALKFLLLTGVRRQEGLNARWEHVDLNRGIWFVPHTKNGKARNVILNEEAKALLESLPRIEDCPWVFPGRDKSKPLNNPRKCFTRVLAAAGIGYLRIHDLRHTFASLCANSGASLFLIQQLLGHASSTTTQRYAHLTADALRQASQSVSAVISSARQAEELEMKEVA